MVVSGLTLVYGRYLLYYESMSLILSKAIIACKSYQSAIKLGMTNVAGAARMATKSSR